MTPLFMSEEEIASWMETHNLASLPVLSADGDPYLIGFPEDGGLFYVSVPTEDYRPTDDGGEESYTNYNAGTVEGAPPEWWPVQPLLPLGVLS